MVATSLQGLHVFRDVRGTPGGCQARGSALSQDRAGPRPFHRDPRTGRPGRLPGLLQIPRVQEYKSPSTLQEALRGREGILGARAPQAAIWRLRCPPRNICPRPSASPCVCWQWACPTLPRPCSGWCAVVSGSEEVNLSPGVGVQTDKNRSWHL